jgi:D-glycero-alpha-D-manno-heptose-7-phosphate kinase
MLIARAPLRISMFGGGTDLPSYYTRYGGAVLSTSIDKFVYVIMNVSERSGLQISSSDYGTFYRHQPGEPLLWDGDLSLPRAVLQHFGIEHGVQLFLASEVPPGTGLGSSSSVTVALVKAVSTACGYKLSKSEVAELASHIEIEKLGRPIGVQDQYASAFGGMNFLTFSEQGVCVEPLDLSHDVIEQLESRLLLMFLGSSHDSAEILSHQRASSQEGDPTVVKSLQTVHQLAIQARAQLLQGSLDGLGELMDEAWQNKRQFAPGVTNAHIDHCYSLARQNGALGGKIAGAGGGGFLMLYCEDGAMPRVEAALSSEGLKRMDTRFETDGARVLFNAGLVLDRTMPGKTGGNL